MSKEKSKGKPANVPTTRTPAMCSDFSGNPGDPVSWQGVPANGCSIQQDGTSTFPFNPGPPINLPSPSTITIKPGLSKGTYTFVVTCCPQNQATKTVDVGG